MSDQNSDSTSVDTTNRFMVGGVGDEILILAPPMAGLPISRELALNLAAWLVALADFEDDRFPEVLEAVRST